MLRKGLCRVMRSGGKNIDGVNWILKFESWNLEVLCRQKYKTINYQYNIRKEFFKITSLYYGFDWAMFNQFYSYYYICCKIDKVSFYFSFLYICSVGPYNKNKDFHSRIFLYRQKNQRQQSQDLWVVF